MSKPIPLNIPTNLLFTKGNIVPGIKNLVIVNDEYTVENFISELLICLFDKSADETIDMIKFFGRENYLIVGIFSQDVIETKIKQLADFAEKRNEHLITITTDVKK